MLQVKVLRSSAEFKELSGLWDLFLDRSLTNPYSLSWPWLTHWLDIYLEDNPLLSIAVFDEDKLVGFAPLWVKRQRQLGIGTLKILRFIGSEEVCTDHLDLIVARKNTDAICATIWEHLYGPLRKEWDIWEYNYVPSDSKVLHSLFQLGNHDNRCLAMTVTGYTICVYVTLPDSWEAYRTSLSRNSRGMLKASTELVEKAGQLGFRVCDRVEDVKEFMEIHIALHRKSWNDRGLPGSFSTEKFRRFHRELCEDLVAKGKLFLCLLEFNGAPVGSSYGFEHNKVMCYYTLGVERDIVPKASLGRIHLGKCIEGAIQRGCREFDMLRGFEDYKYSWTDTERRELLVTIHNRTLAVLIYLFLQFADRFGKQTLKWILGDKTRTVKRWFGKGV
jgi:CelD/BcsL family acetyltransferase involved in cellulose biosynthesis